MAGLSFFLSNGKNAIHSRRIIADARLSVGFSYKGGKAGLSRINSVPPQRADAAFEEKDHEGNEAGRELKENMIAGYAGKNNSQFEES